MTYVINDGTKLFCDDAMKDWEMATEEKYFMTETKYSGLILINLQLYAFSREIITHLKNSKSR